MSQRRINDKHGSSVRPTVLVVEDDPAVRNSLKFMLNIEGFHVRTFGDGSRVLAEHVFPKQTCLIVDQVLPGMTGLDVVEALRKRVGWLPAILVTTHLSDVLRKQADGLGVTIIQKPLLGDVLLRAIRTVLDDATSSST
jgi:two-component system, LuxR family, response regulator FixJ